MATDWGIGSYEPTGEALLPVSEAVIGLAGDLTGKKVLDVGCGTGNAALLAAVRGRAMTGVDPAAAVAEPARVTAPGGQPPAWHDPDELDVRLLAVTRSVDEDPEGFLITNEYVVATAKRK